jgi:phosphoglycerate dehydrogenase-like enzyme
MALMDEPIEVLMTIPVPEELLRKLQSVSPRLNIQVARASQVTDIAADVWVTTEVLYTGRILPTPDQAPNLRWIQFHFTGVDHAQDAEILKQEGVVTTSVSGSSATQIAEYVLMMATALGHKLPDMLEHQHKAVWPKDRWERFSPLEIREATFGIVGYGSIGRQIARLLSQMGAKVLATKRDVMHPEDPGYTVDGFGDPAGNFVQRLYPAEAIRSMAKLVDFLIVAVPLYPATRNLIDNKIFDVMKDTAYIIDVSRGNIVNHADLINALRDHKIAGAALDVFPEEPLPADSPLWKLPNTMITPHISGNTPHYDERAMEVCSENLRRYLQGGKLLNIINVELGY